MTLIGNSELYREPCYRFIHNESGSIPLYDVCSIAAEIATHVVQGFERVFCQGTIKFLPPE